MTTQGRRRVLIGSPVRQKPEILDYFLTSLLRLEQNSLELCYFFIDDNNDELSSARLSRFMKEVNRVVIHSAHTPDDHEYIRDETTHYWNDRLIWKVADYKNKIIQYALDLRFDYLFLVDSDLLLAPQTLIHLIATDKEIISEIFWTRWQPDSRPHPQVWLKDEYTQYEQQAGETLDEAQKEHRYQQFVSRLAEAGVYEVGGLGACTLISRRALVRGVNFKPIYNLSFWGEDRHFSIRAAALGFTLYVDTHYPAYHIYRESDLHHAGLFLKAADKTTSIPEVTRSCLEEREEGCLSPIDANRRTARPSLTLTMVLKNEGQRYLRQALERHRDYIDQAVIIDDASTDNTLDVCMEVLKGIPLRLISNEASLFHNEVELRKQQWRETLNVHPEWILNLDADEWFESSFTAELPSMLKQNEFELYCFRLYDFWNETHYRDDEFWSSHKTYRPFLLRYRPEMKYCWKETAQHCGRFPANVFDLPHHLSAIRLKHYGWAKPEYRLEKLKRYRQLDPEAEFGSKEQYDSILEKSPALVEWME